MKNKSGVTTAAAIQEFLSQWPKEKTLSLAQAASEVRARLAVCELTDNELREVIAIEAMALKVRVILFGGALQDESFFRPIRE